MVNLSSYGFVMAGLYRRNQICCLVCYDFGTMETAVSKLTIFLLYFRKQHKKAMVAGNNFYKCNFVIGVGGLVLFYRDL
ncbi:MAG: hypothetical protein ACLR43_02450 [Faecalibacillus faecis]